MKRILLITLSIVVLLAVTVVIIKVTGTSRNGRSPESASMIERTGQTDDEQNPEVNDIIENADDFSPVLDDYEVELQEDEVIDFK